MPTSVYWYDEDHTVIMEKFEGSWTWQDFAACIHKAIDLIKAVDYPVYAIADYSESAGMPISGSAIKFARDVMHDAPDNWAGVVIVSQNHLIRTLVNIYRTANKRFGEKVYLEQSLKGALNRVQILQASKSNQSSPPSSK